MLNEYGLDAVVCDIYIYMSGRNKRLVVTRAYSIPFAVSVTFEPLGQFSREQHVGEFALAVSAYCRVTLVVVYVVEIDYASCIRKRYRLLSSRSVAFR